MNYNFENTPYEPNGFGSYGGDEQFLYQGSPKKKKSSPWLLIAICAISAILLITGALLLFGDNSDEKSSDIPFFELRYFLNELSEKELEIFCAVYGGLMSFEEEIALPHSISPEDFSPIAMLLCYECPELFQCDYSAGYTYYSGSVPHVKFSYLYSKDEYTSMRRQCEDIINSFITATDGFSDLEKEKYVYDWFGQNCRYDKYKTDADNPYGAFINGYAKCDGISLATKWAMESMGIQCLCIGGSAIDGGAGHAWNIVNIGGNFYLLDTTFGVPTDESVADETSFQTYAGFNTTDTWVNENYTVTPLFLQVARIPKCTIATDSYYSAGKGLVPSGTDPASY